MWHTGIEAKGKKEGRIINIFYYKKAYQTISANSVYIYGVTDTPNPHCQVMSGVIQTTKREVFCGKKINKVLEEPQEEVEDLYTRQKKETYQEKKEMNLTFTSFKNVNKRILN